MKEDDKLKLWEVCLNKPLFRKELEKLVFLATDHDIFDVLKYCYDKYSDMHADVILDVFSNYGKHRSKEKALRAEINEPAKMWD